MGTSTLTDGFEHGQDNACRGIGVDFRLGDDPLSDSMKITPTFRKTGGACSRPRLSPFARLRNPLLHAPPDSIAERRDPDPLPEGNSSQKSSRSSNRYPRDKKRTVSSA